MMKIDLCTTDKGVPPKGPQTTPGDQCAVTEAKLGGTLGKSPSLFLPIKYG